MLPEELRDDISYRVFCNQDTTTMSCLTIVNLETVSYLLMLPGKVLTNVEKEKKNK